MTDAPPSKPRNLETSKPYLAVAAIALLFLLIRIALLAVRAPFFDELFTLWLARQPLGAVLPALLHDSGPPLYYWIARLPSVVALRWLSLLFASGTLAVLLVRRHFLAALLLAVYPAAAVYATEARAYALCGLLVAIAVLELDADRPWTAVLALVAAAYTHYYGVLFFPVLVLVGVPPASRRLMRRRLAAASVAGLAFLPGLILASHQPREAMGWNRAESWWAPLPNLSFTSTTSPKWLIALALIVLLFAIARSLRFAPAVLLPLAVVILFPNLYFPGRFESVLAAPLALWIAASVERYRPELRTSIVAALATIGVLACALDIANYAAQPPDDYRLAATWLARNAAPHEPVVATGYLYLETIVLRPAIAFPPEQAQHPGWRAVARDGSGLPAGAFLWIGERQSPELRMLARRRIEPLFVDERAMVARVR